jgi:hypothetical protein
MPATRIGAGLNAGAWEFAHTKAVHTKAVHAKAETAGRSE